MKGAELVLGKWVSRQYRHLSSSRVERRQRGEGVMIKKSKSASSKVGGGQAKYGTGFRRGNDLLNYRIGGNGIPGSRTNIGHILSSVEGFAKTEEELMA